MSDWAMAGPESSPGRLIEQDNIRNFGQMAQANYTNTLADKLRTDTERTQKLVAAFSNPAATTDNNGKPLTPDQQLYADADRLRALGYPEQAAKVVTEGATTAARLATAAAVTNNQKLAQITKADDTLTAISGFYDGVTNQDEFDRANGMVNAVTGLPSPLAGQQWSPHLATMLKNSQMTARQRAMLPLEQDRLRAQTEAQEALARAREERLRLQEEMLKLRREKLEHDMKVGGPGGKDVGNPSRTETSQSALLIKDKYPDLPAADLAHYSYLIASDARAIRKQNPGISAEEANQRALEQNADQISEVVVTEKVLGSEMLGGLIGKTSTRTSFNPRQKGSSFPKAAPGMTYRNGDKYTLPDGRIGIRKNGGFDVLE